MFKKTTCQILLHTDVSWKRYGLLKLMWYYTTFGLEQAKKVVHIAHLITPDSARQLILRTSKLMSAHLVKYAASARDLSLFHCDVLHSSSAVQHSTDPGIVYVYVSTQSSQWQICLHARIVHMLSMQWIHTHLCVHINAWISVRMLPHQFLFVTPTCAASHASRPQQWQYKRCIFMRKLRLQQIRSRVSMTDNNRRSKSILLTQNTYRTMLQHNAYVLCTPSVCVDRYTICVCMYSLHCMHVFTACTVWPANIGCVPASSDRERCCICMYV